MSINWSAIFSWYINQWFWFSIFTSAYVIGIIIFYNDAISVNSLVLSGDSKKEAIEKHNYIKKYYSWDIFLIDLCTYIPLVLVCWIPIFHIFFFVGITNLTFATNIDEIEANRVEVAQKRKELDNKKEELVNLLSEISEELAKQNKDEKSIKDKLKNDSTNTKTDLESKNEVKNDSVLSQFYKNKKDDDWDNYTEL